MAHPVASGANPPDSFSKNIRNCCAKSCLLTGMFFITPVALKFGYDALAKIAPVPLSILSTTTSLAGKAFVSTAGFIANNYSSATYRYVSGNDLKPGDSSTLFLGTALAISLMVLGCRFFASSKK